MVTIWVGPERKRFLLHEELICARSKFFHSAFKSDFEESARKEMSMPEDDPITFGHLVDWLYLRRVSCAYADEDETDPESFGIDHPLWDRAETVRELQWAKLWVLADKIGDDALKLEAQHKYANILESFPSFPSSVEAVRYVYENTLESAEIRRVLVDCTVRAYYQQQDTQVAALTMSASSDFAIGVLAKMAEHMNIQTQKECTYEFGCKLHRGACGYGPDKSLWATWVEEGYNAGMNGQPMPTEGTPYWD